MTSADEDRHVIGESTSQVSPWYLSYYQAIEYFFPQFINREAINRIRNRMRDPRFDFEVDSDIQQIVTHAQLGWKGTSEPEQIRATVQQCVDDDMIVSYFASLPEDDRKFFTNATPLVGVPALKISAGADLARQVADRIYKLRNRIVHAKESKADERAPALLPYSVEANLLALDLRLAEYVCERVIIAGSTERLV